jgi:GNAT superfamily N-acetyltransferase
MQFASITPAQHAEFLRLVNAEIRPDRAKTNAWDDFPLILDPENRAWTLAATNPAGELVGGLACLVREFTTSCGKIPVAGIGSVVTRADWRGRGISTALQNTLLARLRGKNVPLAVLWTDQPEIYAGRGFAPAGWEWHLDLGQAELAVPCPPGFSLRPFKVRDVPAVQALYDRHPLRTVRLVGDAERLYNMPGTRGLVGCGGGNAVAAAVFCGKGADFPDYVTEWSGPLGLVTALLAAIKQQGWARHLLAPAGSEELVSQLVRRGAVGRAQSSGLWAVLQPERLGQYLQAAGVGAPADLTDPAQVLGTVDPNGQPLAGSLTVSVWGFDSV